MFAGAGPAAVGLQWGRVLMNAETARPGAIGGRSRYASMGPRSHERGNWRFDFRTKDKPIASMGPRSHERGNVILGPDEPALVKDASMGPRSHERGNSNTF